MIDDDDVDVAVAAIGFFKNARCRCFSSDSLSSIIMCGIFSYFSETTLILSSFSVTEIVFSAELDSFSKRSCLIGDESELCSCFLSFSCRSRCAFRLGNLSTCEEGWEGENRQNRLWISALILPSDRCDTSQSEKHPSPDTCHKCVCLYISTSPPILSCFASLSSTRSADRRLSYHHRCRHHLKNEFTQFSVTVFVLIIKISLIIAHSKLTWFTSVCFSKCTPRPAL